MPMVKHPKTQVPKQDRMGHWHQWCKLSQHPSLHYAHQNLEHTIHHSPISPTPIDSSTITNLKF
jgi:hypothetical protein